jgi:DNA-binding MarR family transcriptional regulator
MNGLQYMGSHEINPGASADAPSAAVLGADAAARDVLDAIRRIVRALREGSRDSERSLGLSAAQVFVLHRLAGAPPLSVNDLAQRTLTHQSSVSVVVSKLVERGLVARVPSPHDARRVEITLTKQGRALIGRAPAAAPQDRLIAGLALLGPRRRRVLAQALRGLVETMALSDGPAPMFFERAAVPRPSKPSRPTRPTTSGGRPRARRA